MILLQAHNISKSYGGYPILAHINLEIKSNERIGLVGRNGAGKTTLVNILVGKLAYDHGEIFKSKSVQLGYLAQDSGLDSNKSIWEEMKTVFSSLIKQENHLRQLEQQMADERLTHNQYQSLLQEYATLSDAFKDNGGYQYEAMIRNVLHGLRFDHKDYNDPVSTLSGGQKTRLALAKLLLEQPDILILDEPTNYLDLESLTWLEQYLLAYPGAILVVSHDRYFLDALVHVIYEIERGKGSRYIGSYTQYLEQKAERYARELKQYTKQQQEIRNMEEFIQRNIARASTSKRAQSRRKQLQKMERLDQPDGALKSASFSFQVDRPSGNDVYKVNDVQIGYTTQHVLAQHITLEVYRGERLAIVGPNGVGKTTLLKTMAGKIAPVAGSIETGSNVSTAYYDQEQNQLNPQKTILAEVWDDYPHLLEKEARGLLDQFLFSGDEVVDKHVHDLSGGEKSRLSLAKLMLQQANVLMLDEPTNHLDIESKEVLEEALHDYPGTIIFVSHDRYFINRIATKVVELASSGTQTFLGDYDYYVQKKQEQTEIKQLQEKQGDIKNDVKLNHTHSVQIGTEPSSYEEEKERKQQERKRERRLEQLEERIEALEERIQGLEDELYLPEVYEDYEKAAEVQEELSLLENERDQLLEDWARLEDDSSLPLNRK